MSLITDPTSTALHAALSGLAMRQRVTADNIANVNTPGFLAGRTDFESALSGDKVTALCGKKWIPGRDPGRFPVCPTCKEIFASMPPGGDDES